MNDIKKLLSEAAARGEQKRAAEEALRLKAEEELTNRILREVPSRLLFVRLLVKQAMVKAAEEGMCSLDLCMQEGTQFPDTTELNYRCNLMAASMVVSELQLVDGITFAEAAPTKVGASTGTSDDDGAGRHPAYTDVVIRVGWKL